jgi:sulfatase maturation enzyme AslB (radical SAM superfamily)
MDGRPLRMMTLALTGACNLKCQYCYQNAKSGAQMPWNLLRAAADRVLESASAHVEVVFAGGEPLLALGLIRRAVEYIEGRRHAGCGVRFNLATNGTMLDAGTIAFLDQHHFDIQLSFDGVLPAQSVRGEHSFARIDAALDALRAAAPGTLWRRLLVGVTLDAGAVPYLSESFSYFLGKRLPAISISPAAGQAARWTPDVLATFDREMNAVYALARRHYEEHGEVPLVTFRKTSSAPTPPGAGVCGAAGPGSVTIDVDGQAYACPMLAESSQRFANPGLAAIVKPMKMGHVASPEFWSRVAAEPEHARGTRMFHVGRGRHSLHGRCLRCPYVRDCTVCPAAVLSEPAHENAERIPDYLCAFSWTLLRLRKRFPVQPDMAAVLTGRARPPRQVRRWRSGESSATA